MYKYVIHSFMRHTRAENISRRFECKSKQKKKKLPECFDGKYKGSIDIMLPPDVFLSKSGTPGKRSCIDGLHFL